MIRNCVLLSHPELRRPQVLFLPLQQCDFNADGERNPPSGQSVSLTDRALLSQPFHSQQRKTVILVFRLLIQSWTLPVVTFLSFLLKSRLYSKEIKCTIASLSNPVFLHICKSEKHLANAIAIFLSKNLLLFWLKLHERQLALEEKKLKLG